MIDLMLKNDPGNDEWLVLFICVQTCHIRICFVTDPWLILIPLIRICF